MRPKVTGIVELQNLDQVVVAGVGPDQAMLQKECPTLEPSLRRLLGQGIRDFIGRIEGSVTSEELCRQWPGPLSSDPPVGKNLDGDAESFADLANGQGVPGRIYQGVI